MDAPSLTNVKTSGHAFTYIVDCPLCPYFVGYARDEGMAWMLAEVHDEFERHEAGTAYVVRDCQG